MALVLPMMSKRVLLDKESSRDAEIWIFSPATCPVVNATDLAAEGPRSLIFALGLTSSLLGSHWQMMTQSLPFAKCECFLRGGMPLPQILHSSQFPCMGGKNGQECKRFKFSYVLEKHPSTISFQILSISNLPFEADVLFFHKIDAFLVLTMSLEHVKHWFPF